MTAASKSGVRSGSDYSRRRNVLVRWWLNLPLRDKGLLVVVVLPLATLVAAVFMPIPYSEQQRRTAALAAHVAEAQNAEQELLITLLELESAIRSYALKRDPALLDRIATVRQSVPEHIQHVSRLLIVPDNQRLFTNLSDAVQRELLLVDGFLPPSHTSSRATDHIDMAVSSGQELLDSVSDTLVTLRQSQTRMLAESDAELERRRRRLTPLILATLFGGLAAALIAGWLFGTGVAGRIAALERNAERLANGERLHYEASRGLDEIGSLDQTLRRASLRLRTRERELREVNARLERTVHEQVLLNRELEAFSYSVSHDLRAPLRSIDGFAQALRDDWGDRLDDTAQDHLARVRNAAQRMGQLIDDLLKLSRLTRSQIQRTNVNLSALARQVSADLQERNPSRQVDWVIPDGLHAWCDPALARILLENLLGNAWKFTSKTVDARIEFDVTPNTHPRLFFVRDNGAGFDMRYVEKLFAPFQRLHGEREFPGTGIGLATVQRIVHKHGGHVRTRAEVGSGATFYFTLAATEGSEAVA